MENNGDVIKIFMLPRQASSCGPSCNCGPVGQSQEEIQGLKGAIEQKISKNVEVYDVTDGKVMKNYLTIIRLVRSFSIAALPMITLNDEVVAMGAAAPEQAVAAVREKMNQTGGATYANV